MRGSVLFWAVIIYMATLLVLIIPAAFFYSPDDVAAGATTGANTTMAPHSGPFTAPESMSDQQRQQIYLTFMIPIAAGLNALAIYLLHYRHVRKQYYRVEKTEGENLLCSTATRSIFADPRMGRVLQKGGIQPLVLYGTQKADVVPVYKPRVGATAAELASGTYEVPVGDGLTYTRSGIVGAPEPLTLDHVDVPSKLSRRMRGRYRPQNISSHGPIRFWAQHFVASDVQQLVATAQEINEAAESIRQDINRLYAELLEDTNVMAEHVERVKRRSRSTGPRASGSSRPANANANATAAAGAARAASAGFAGSGVPSMMPATSRGPAARTTRVPLAGPHLPSREHENDIRSSSLTKGDISHWIASTSAPEELHARRE